MRIPGVSSLFPCRAASPARVPQPPPPPAAHGTAASAPARPPAFDESRVGELDDVVAGWFNTHSQEVVPGFPIGGDDIVVDVGPGDGLIAAFCARYAAETVLIDTDTARLAGTIARIRGEGSLNARAEPGDAASLPIPDAYATRVVCTEVMEHVDDPARAMAELVRIGRPGARYLLSVPAEGSESLQQKLAPDLYFQKPNHVRIFRGDAFAELVEASGLVIERRLPNGFFWTVFWALFWKCDVESIFHPHPVLDAWRHTWSELLHLPGGPDVKRALDGLAPKAVTLVARKPGGAAA